MRTREEQRIIDAACDWWRHRRPLSFTLEEHLDNPTVNTVGGDEAAVARAVAKYTRAGHGNGKDGGSNE